MPHRGDDGLCYGAGVDIGAIALLKINYRFLCTALDVEPAANAKEAIASMATFVPIGADGTACLLDAPFASSPEDLAGHAVDLLGSLVERSDDERGVFVVPDGKRGSEALSDVPLTSYDAAVAHFGDAGQWIPKAAIAETLEAPAAGGDPLAALLGGAGLGGPGLSDAIANIQSQLAANPQMASALGSMGENAVGPDGAPSGDLLSMAQQMLSQMSPEQQAELERMAKSMFGSLDPGMLAGMQQQLAAGAAHDDDDADDPEFGGGDEPAPPKKG